VWEEGGVGRDKEGRRRRGESGVGGVGRREEWGEGRGVD